MHHLKGIIPRMFQNIVSAENKTKGVGKRLLRVYPDWLRKERRNLFRGG